MASVLWMLGKWCTWQNNGIQCQSNEYARLGEMTVTGLIIKAILGDYSLDIILLFNK